MLESLYIFYSVVAFFFLSIGYYFFNKRFESVLFFAISSVLFGVLIFSGIAIENVVAVLNPSTGEIVTASAVHVNYAMLGLNIIFFTLSMLFFYMDLMLKLPKITNHSVQE